MLRVLIADDEAPARAKIARLLEGDLRFVVVGQARDGLETLDAIERLAPDVVMLDVQMPGLDGFEVLDACAEPLPFAVVFSTAYDQHALRAFDANAVDYLLKPYSAQRFARALEKLALRPSLTGLRENTRRERLALRTLEGAWVSVELERIVSLSSANKYTCIRTLEGEHLVRQPIQALEARLGAGFVRVHRGQIVRVAAVVQLQPAGHGDARLLLRDGTVALLARSRRDAFFACYAPQPA